MLMKKIYILAIFISLGISQLTAQSRFAAAPAPCSTEFTYDENEPDRYCGVKVKNQINSSINILWQREDLILPETWNAYVCDGNSCYSPFVKKCPADNPNIVKANSQVELDVHVNTDGQDGAHIVMWVFEKEDTTQRIKVDYLFNKTLSSNQVKNISMKMYPNPAQNAFTLEYNTGVKRLELISLLGKQLANFKTAPNKSYDISFLEDGLYMVRFIGVNNLAIRTVRLEKRSLRP